MAQITSFCSSKKSMHVHRTVYLVKTMAQISYLKSLITARTFLRRKSCLHPCWSHIIWLWVELLPLVFVPSASRISRRGPWILFEKGWMNEREVERGDCTRPVVRKASTCNASVPYGCEFVSWLFHFRSGSLLVAWEKQQKMEHVFGPLPTMWDT